jgi:hypothetical protein
VQSPLTVTNTATEPNIHSITIGYTLVSPPVGMVIDTNGIISYVKIGPFLNADEIKALIDPLLP